MNSRGRALAAFAFFAAGLVAAACGDATSGGVAVEPDASEPAADAATSGKDDAGKDGASDAKSSRDAADAASDSAADAGDAGWPDCEAKPSGVATKTLPAIWAENAAAPAEAWVEDVVVTAVSRGGCQAGKACQIYLQSGTSFPSLASAAHRAIKLFVSAATASHFTSVAVGDRVDVLAWGWRYSLDGQSEILLQVNAALPGCTKKKGTASVTPIAVELSALTHASYEAHGPLLVSLAQTSGKAQASPTETFGLYETGFDGGFDAGAEIVSLSPFFLPNASFAGTPVTLGAVNAFTSLTGVFGLFTPGVPDGSAATTYLELCPRSAADLVK